MTTHRKTVNNTAQTRQTYKTAEVDMRQVAVGTDSTAIENHRQCLHQACVVFVYSANPSCNINTALDIYMSEHHEMRTPVDTEQIQCT